MRHLPIGLEYFELLSPTKNDKILTRNVVLKWEKSRDPDLYDQINCTLLLDQDSTKLSNLISIYDRDSDKFFSELNKSKTSFLTLQSVKIDSFLTNNLTGGNYY